MNFITVVSRVVLLISAIVIIVVSIVGLIKGLKIKRRRKARFGYNSLTKVAQVNILKNKAERYHKLGMIPTGLNDLYQELTRDSSVGYARFLNKLTKKYKKRKKYYTKKNPMLDKGNSNTIMYTVGVFKKSHKKLFEFVNANTERVY